MQSKICRQISQLTREKVAESVDISPRYLSASSHEQNDRSIVYDKFLSETAEPLGLLTGRKAGSPVKYPDAPPGPVVLAIDYHGKWSSG